MNCPGVSIVDFENVNADCEVKSLFGEGDILQSTTQKMKFSIKDFSSKCDHLLKKSLMENLIFCAVKDKEITKLTLLGTYPLFPCTSKMELLANMSNDKVSRNTGYAPGPCIRI